MERLGREFTKKIQSFKFLTREEESDLFQAMQSDDKKKAEQARELILNCYLKLARTYAHRRKATSLCRDMPYEDLFQEAAAALCVAIDKFDTSLNVRFSTYAHFWLKNGLDEYVMKTRSILKISSSYNVKRAMAFYTRSKDRIKKNNTGIDFETLWGLIAEDLKIEVDVVKAVGQINEFHIKSLDQAPASNPEGNLTLADMIADPNDTVFEDVERQMDFEKLIGSLNEFANSLNKRDEFIFRNRTLKDSDDKLNLQELGEIFNISRERVRQLENIILKKLEEFFSQSETLKKVVAEL